MIGLPDFTNGDLDVLETQRQLVGIELLRGLAKAGALQFAQEMLEALVAGLELLHLRLEMRPGRSLGIKLSCLESQRLEVRRNGRPCFRRQGIKVETGQAL